MVKNRVNHLYGQPLTLDPLKAWQTFQKSKEPALQPVTGAKNGWFSLYWYFFRSSKAIDITDPEQAQATVSPFNLGAMIVRLR